MSTSETIRQTVATAPPGSVFSSADFLFAGTRAAVDQALYRLMRAGVLTRVARGLYVPAGHEVDLPTLALAVAHRTGEKVAVMPCSNSHDGLVMPTSGLSRTLRVSNHTLEFRRMSHRKVQLAGSPKGQVMLELWSRGKNHLTVPDIQRATEGWSDHEINAYASSIPRWLYTAIQKVHQPRKSIKMGLSGGYDWSNPNIQDNALITKVLERHKFEDVARICIYYGIQRVRRVFRQRSFHPMIQASVTRMLGNIGKGLSMSKKSEHE